MHLRMPECYWGDVAKLPPAARDNIVLKGQSAYVTFLRNVSVASSVRPWFFLILTMLTWLPPLKYSTLLLPQN